jgi:hypothetical protein
MLPSGLTLRGRNAALALLGHTYLLVCLAVHAGMLQAAILCPFRWLTGMDCPLCGLSRAFGCLLTGNIAAALRYHPLAPELFTLWVICTALTAVHSLIAGGPWLRRSATDPAAPTPPPSHRTH